MIQLTNGKRDGAAAAPAAGAKEGSIWTLAHKQCSGSKATVVSTENPKPHDHLRDADSEPTPASAGVWEPRLS